MKSRLKTTIRYFAFWLLYFQIGRGLFIAYHGEASKTLSGLEIFQSFVHGLLMDCSTAAYITLFVLILIAFSSLINNLVLRRIIWIYTLLVLIISSLLTVIDLELFNAWGFRIDKTPLRYLSNPKEAWASSENAPVWIMLLLFVTYLSAAIWLFRRFVLVEIKDWPSLRFIPSFITWLLLAGFMIIPIRGGLGIAPMNQASVYFSKNNFANISAINPVWNFIASLVNSHSGNKNPYVFMSNSDAKAIVDTLYQSAAPQEYMVDTNVKNPNVLIIIWESFTKKAVARVQNGVPVTPRFNELKNEGIWFDNMYAVGDRTDKGLTAVLSGYPTQPTESIVKHPEKTNGLYMLSKDFKKKGYQTNFYYGGESNFANIKTYLYAGGFDNIIDLASYPAEQATSKWGVHDEFTFKRFLKDFSVARTQSFFCTFLTLSSHEPFETTRAVAVPGADVTDKFMNSIHYTDEILGEFIDAAKQSVWWKNTIIIIVADHGHRLPETAKKMDDFKIPMLWLGGPIKKPITDNSVGSQMDLAATLLAQLRMDHKDYVWSKNLFKQHQPWAYFSFNNGFGFVKDSSQIIFDNVGRQIIESNGTASKQVLKEGQALEQLTFQDYLNR